MRTSRWASGDARLFPWSNSPFKRMSTGATHLHGASPEYLSACKRLTRFRPSAQLTGTTMDENASHVERVIGFDCHPDTFTAAILRGPTPAAADRKSTRLNSSHGYPW